MTPVIPYDNHRQILPYQNHHGFIFTDSGRVTRPQSCYAVTNFSGRSGLGPHWIPLHVIQGGKKWGSSSHDSVKTKTPCHNTCVTIEILPAHRPCKAMSEGLDFVSRHWLCWPLHMNAIFSSKTLNKIQPTNQFFHRSTADYCTGRFHWHDHELEMETLPHTEETCSSLIKQ